MLQISQEQINAAVCALERASSPALFLSGLSPGETLLDPDGYDKELWPLVSRSPMLASCFLRVLLTKPDRGTSDELYASAFRALVEAFAQSGDCPLDRARSEFLHVLMLDVVDNDATVAVLHCALSIGCFSSAASVVDLVRAAAVCNLPSSFFANVFSGACARCRGPHEDDDGRAAIVAPLLFGVPADGRATFLRRLRGDAFEAMFSDFGTRWTWLAEWGMTREEQLSLLSNAVVQWTPSQVVLLASVLLPTSSLSNDFDVVVRALFINVRTSIGAGFHANWTHTTQANLRYLVSLLAKSGHLSSADVHSYTTLLNLQCAFDTQREYHVRY